MCQKDARGSGKKVAKHPQPVIGAHPVGKATLGMDEVQAGVAQSRTVGSAGGTQGPSEQIMAGPVCPLPPEWRIHLSSHSLIYSSTDEPGGRRYSKIKTGFRFGGWALAAVSAFICHLTPNKACHHSEPAK